MEKIFFEEDYVVEIGKTQKEVIERMAKERGCTVREIVAELIDKALNG